MSSFNTKDVYHLQSFMENLSTLLLIIHNNGAGYSLQTFLQLV